MKKILFIFLISLSSLTVICQDPPPDDDKDVVNINTTLIQFDVVVTDKKGNQITDLKPEDFEVFENGEKQSITDFSYVSITKEKKALPTAKPDKYSPPVPANITAAQVSRTIAIVVDDLTMSFGGIDSVKYALKKYVETQMQPGDLVAIIRTSGGIGALQQFTTDRRLLFAAIDKIRWYPGGRGKIGDFSPIEPSFKELLSNQTPAALGGAQDEGGSQVTAEQAKAEREMISASENIQDDIFTSETLGAVSYVVRGMKELPGRKSILLYSNGFSLVTRDSKTGSILTNARVESGLRSLIDLSNRSAVSIYTADARGLVGVGLTAEDNTYGLNSDQVIGQLEDRRNDLRDTQDGLRTLAEETGGRSYINNNDLNAMINKTLNEQSGYYLVAYEPDEESFDPKKRKFNKLTVKVKRPDLVVRYRSGFFGVSDEDRLQKQISGSQQMIKAITSPFNAADIGLRSNSIYLNDASKGSYIKTYMHMPGKDVKFKDGNDGWKTASFEILAILFGDNGVAAEQMNSVYTLRIKNEEYNKILADGLVYNFEFPTTKYGAYQLRIVLRDNENSKVGSVSQFLEIPNFKKKRLNLSGIALENYTQNEWQKVSQVTTGNSLQTNYPYGALRDSSRRQYKRNTILSYDYFVYNAKTGSNLKTQTRLFRNGEIVFEGATKPLNTNNQKDSQRIYNNGAMILGNQLSDGDYVLQILVTDETAKDKYKVATQWIDFEIID